LGALTVLPHPAGPVHTPSVQSVSCVCSSTTHSRASHPAGEAALKGACLRHHRRRSLTRCAPQNDWSGPIEAVQQASRARGLLSSLATEHRCEATLLTIVHRDELAAIATAVGDEVNPEEGLGTRILPPIADVWAAEQSADEQTYWLSKADADETVLDTYRKRLVFAREHGYVMSYLYAGQQDAYQSLQDATHRYADGATTPTAHREIRRTISNTAVNYTMCDIDPLHVYDVGMLAAAVRDPSGAPVRILRLAQLPRQASGSAVPRLDQRPASRCGGARTPAVLRAASRHRLRRLIARTAPGGEDPEALHSDDRWIQH